MVASPRHHKRSAVVAGPLNERTNSHPTGSGKSTAVVPTAERSSSTSLRIELQQEQISALMCELDQLQAQLTDARVASTSAESVHAGERGELVASYERMLSEQAAAVRQYEARAACVGSLRLEARKRESELAAVRQESVAVRQRLTVVTKVWRQSVIELEASLESEVGLRNALEAERAKFAEIHRKKLQALQREADERSREAKKVADREEQAVQVAAMAAARQAERSFELKAKDLKAKTDETLKKERSQQRHEIHNALAEAEAERERIRYEGMETVEVARREAAEQVVELKAAHRAELAMLERRRATDALAMHADLLSLETELGGKDAKIIKAETAAAEAARISARTISGLKEIEKDLRGQLTASRTAHSNLSNEFEKLKLTSAQEKAAAETAASVAVLAAKREVEEAQRQAVDEVKQMQAALERAEGEVTRACQLKSDAERNKLIANQRKELTRLQQAADEKLAEERTSMRTRLEKARKDVEKKDKELARLRESKGHVDNAKDGPSSKGHAASPPPTTRNPNAIHATSPAAKSKQGTSPTKSPSVNGPSTGQSRPRSVSAPRSGGERPGGADKSPERASMRRQSEVASHGGGLDERRGSRDREASEIRSGGSREASFTASAGEAGGGGSSSTDQSNGSGSGREGGSGKVNIVVDMANLAGVHGVHGGMVAGGMMIGSMHSSMAPPMPLPAGAPSAAPPPSRGSANASPRNAPLRPDGAELANGEQPEGSEGQGPGGQGASLERAEGRAEQAEAALVSLRKRTAGLEVALADAHKEVAAAKDQLRQLQQQQPPPPPANAHKERELPTPPSKQVQGAAGGRAKSPARGGGGGAGAGGALSYSEERAQAAKEAKAEAARLAALEADILEQQRSAQEEVARERAEVASEREAHAKLRDEKARLDVALDVAGEEVHMLESALVAAAVSQRLRFEAEKAKEAERQQVSEALATAKEAEEKSRQLRGEVRAAEAAAAAARATAAQERAAAEAATSSLEWTQKEAEEKLERALHEASAQAKSVLVQEKSKAQAEARKAIARAEREGEGRLLAQRDEFAKQERGLREKIVSLQNDVSAIRQKAAREDGKVPSLLGTPAGSSSGSGGGGGGGGESVRSHMGSARSNEGSARKQSPGRSRVSSAGGEASAEDLKAALKHAEAAAAEAHRAAATSNEALRKERESGAVAAEAATSFHEATVSVLIRELLGLEVDGAEECAAAERLRERLAMETRHLQRKLSRVTKESEQRMAEERTALEARLAETSRRSEAKLRAERTRLAVRYGNQGKQLVQQKMGELQLGSSDPLEQQD